MNSKCFKNNTETERLSRSEAVDCVKDGVLIIPDSKKILDLDFAFFVVREDLPHIHIDYSCFCDKYCQYERRT